MSNKLLTLWRYLRTPKKFKSRAQIEKWQRKRVAKHIKFVRKNSVFYANHWQGLGDEDWQKFPLVNKASMMDNLENLLTIDLDLEEAFSVAKSAEITRDFSPRIGDLSIGFSSGTSGSRGVHIVSDKEASNWAGFMLARGLGGSIFGKHHVALFLRANSNNYGKIGSKRIKFSFFDLLKPMDQLQKEVELANPTELIAPPSVLRYLAENNCKITPKRIISAAEVLDPIDEKIISEYFSQIVHQFYTSTEGEMAATCEFGTLHLNESIMHIGKQWVDEENGLFHPILTDFMRTTQPIIRYLQNDILVLQKEGCKCGDARTAISQIMGRSDDVFYLQKNNSDEFEPIVPDFIRRAVMRLNPKIEAYHAIQKSRSKIEIGLQPTNLDPLDFSGFEELFKEKNVRKAELIITEHSHIPSTNKLRRIYRECEME
jgi:putative adenylate-forming enzyme